MKTLSFLFLTFCFLKMHAQNQPPVLSDVQATFTGANTLTLTYDLFDAENDPVAVTFRAAEKGGGSFSFSTVNATGDVGAGIASGAARQIVWDYSAYAATNSNFRLMLVADDLQEFDLQAVVDQVDSNRLKTDLDFIEGVRHRTAGAAHLEATKEFILAEMLESALDTQVHTFAYSGYQAHNLLGKKIGTQNETSVLILGGHFDTVNNSPGADDNGSAVAGVLEAARVLSKYAFKKSIRFIGFDLEEPGLVGSNKYLQTGQQAGETIEGMFDFEMIGYYSEAANSQVFPAGFNLLFPDAYNEVANDDFKGNFITNVGKAGNSTALMTAYENAAAAYVPALKVVSVTAPANWQTLTPDLGRSDHAPFWMAGLPAIMLTDGADFRNQNYHTPQDVASTLNFSFMENVVKATVATIAELADIQHATTWWTDTDFTSPALETDAGGCDFRLSPNPAGHTLTLTWVNCTAPVQQVEILNLAGQTVFSKKIKKAGIEKMLTLELGDLKSGSYVVQVTTKEGVKTRQVVVK